MQVVIHWLSMLRRIGQKAGPYLMLEMLLPGGTLFALLLFLYRRHKAGVDSGIRQAVAEAVRTLANVFDNRILLPLPLRRNRQTSTVMRSES
ncbi:MAG: hypothetical protein ABI881_10295 [Betaproteobacteria bacterium]